MNRSFFGGGCFDLIQISLISIVVFCIDGGVFFGYVGLFVYLNNSIQVKVIVV